uniref:Uncharacterized protein n=1 Tax=Glossina brevipalpis TaxID=37001 RepID=A0A1A9WM43_9MUSC
MSSFDSENVSESNQHQQQKNNLAKTTAVVKAENAEDTTTTTTSNLNRNHENLDENEKVIITYKHRVVDEQCPIGDNKRKVDNDGELEGGNCAIIDNKDDNKLEAHNVMYKNVNVIEKVPDKDSQIDEKSILELSETYRSGVPICGNGDNPNLNEAQLSIDCHPSTMSIRDGKLLLAEDNLSMESSTDENPSVAQLVDTINTKLIGSDTDLKCELSKSGITSLKTSSYTVPSLTPTSTLPPLPTANKFNISHTSSDPSFGAKLRQTHQHNVLNESSSPSWRSDTSGPYSSVVKSGTMSESASPNMIRKTSVSTVSLPRRVSFPKSDNELVTGYLEPANPWEHVCMVKSISEIAELYVTSCQKHNTKPLQCVLEHLKGVDLQNQLRQPLLSLKSIKLRPSDCEALEEVFKRVQYKSIDLSNCELDETAASAIFEMIEYYEATNELDISSNPSGMTHRGWVSCNYMIGHSQELQVLNAEGNPISKMSADNLGNALSTSNLHTLKLEHCGLRGSPLSNLSFKLRNNRTLRELWLGYNDLDCNDADAIAELLKVNHYLELIDVSNNNMKDEGLRHIVRALIMQSKELERRSTLKRTAAIDDDDSALQTEPLLFQDDLKSCRNEWKSSDRVPREISSPEPLETRDEKDEDNYVSSVENEIQTTQNDVRSGGGDCDMRSNEREFLDNPPALEEIDGDEDTEDTIRSSTVKNSSQNSGQSMLDKLLSMNSESSSEDGTSNLSTDTLAACCSEDTSLISDDILDATTTTSTLNTNTNIKAQILEGHTIAPFTMQTSGASCPNLIQSSPMVLLDTSDEYKSKIDKSSISVTLGPAITETISGSVSLNQNNNLTSNSASPKNNRLNNNIIATRNQSEIYEVTAEEGFCVHSSVDASSNEHQSLMQHHSASKALDVNKNTKIIEDFDDTHSTDSAFESASEGDISRHLPEDFTRLSTSLESSRLDDLGKEPAIETATIASESNECLIATAVSATTASTLTSFTPPFARIKKQLAECERYMNKSSSNSCLSTSLPDNTTVTPTVKLNFGSLEEPTNISAEPIREIRENIPKVTISEDNMILKAKSIGGIMPTCSPTPPPPSTSPGGSSSGLRRTESSCAFLTQSSRTCSQSTDSLSSENSLDGSIGSGDINFSSSTQLNEKLTKNDTLTRQQRQMDVLTENTHRAPNGLKALSIWNNNLTKEAGLYISDLLADTVSLELLNIGKNCLSNDFVSSIKDSLTKNTTLTTLGLQSAHLSAKGIETLSSILTFGGNSTLQRIDIRDNKLEVESLTTIAEVLKSNTTITQIDIDDESKRLSVGSDAHLDYARVLENVRSMCSRNEKAQIQMHAEKTIANAIGRKRGGYYLGSRKISLTCHGRPIGESMSKNITGGQQLSNSKLEVKRKPGTRLRSPVPSPPSVSPSSSPNRASRFQVFRVVEVSPLTSPMGQKTLGANVPKAVSSSSVSIPTTEGNYHSQHYSSLSNLSLPTSSSLPSMTTISSSTQSIKRLSISPRSRFHVKKIYEDPMVPLAHRTVPPIIPTIMPLHVSNAVKGTKESTNTKLNTNDLKLDTKVIHNLPDLVPSSTTSAFSSTFTTTNTYSLPTTSLSLTTVPPLPYTVAPSAVVTDIKTEQSTNTTITISSNVDAQAETNNIIPSPSTLSSISALSSSSSLSASSSSSTSSSSTSPASNADSSDVSSVASIEVASQQESVASGQCPLAVFSDNDITLTKNTVNEALANAAAASMIATKETSSLIDHTDAATTFEDNVTPQSTQRVRKVSWISNPTAVDKLLTLFHNPTTIFQRSTSPESKSAPNTQSNPSISNATETTLAIQQQTAKSLLPLRKQSPPSWTKLSTDILNATSSGNVEVMNIAVTTATTVVAEQSRSFLDAASKQFRDFSKQVFRQNLSFGNEAIITTPLTTTVTTASVISTVGCSASGVLGSSVSATTCLGCPGSIECDAGLIPTDVKQEIKENISPEHTVNEETIHSFQKLCNTTEIAEPKDNETIVLDTKDCSGKKGNDGPQEEPSTHNT